MYTVVVMNNNKKPFSNFNAHSIVNDYKRSKDSIKIKSNKRRVNKNNN